MPVQTILRYPHPLLKKICNEVDFVDEQLHTLVEDLLDTMRAGPGSVGVAAPQIGVTLRVCVVDVSASRHGKDNNHGLLTMINPEILESRGVATMREGCMSVPDYTGDVDRATEIRVRFSELDQTVREFTATGFEAVAIQHEMDHLDGILFLDRIISVKTGLFRRKNYK
ncbi:peptide deformylase [Pelotalea chapellei]|uniref:Peptide deformylase n=1 Tax=Pelotalea chapellei TaxID=44671 RepID=A0ABS5U839_9BACT|nr:peptide deformylase [Pelotalea chapellei]MBT1071838.1 peptide deformylase [Pelotalea chapellei]